MATQRPLSPISLISSRTIQQDQEDQKILDDLLVLVPVEPLTQTIRQTFNDPSIGDEMRILAKKLKNDPPVEGFDVLSWANDIERHADDPASEEVIVEEVLNARYIVLTRWVSAMLRVARRGEAAARLTESLTPCRERNFWKRVGQEVPLDLDADKDPTVKGFVQNVLKALPLRLPRETIISRALHQNFGASDSSRLRSAFVPRSSRAHQCSVLHFRLGPDRGHKHHRGVFGPKGSSFE